MDQKNYVKTQTTDLSKCEVCGSKGNIQSIGNRGYMCGDCGHKFYPED